MIFRLFYYFDTGCAAYVLGCAGKGCAAVVDPQERDVGTYIEFATAKGMRITHVIDTHIHADHGGEQEIVTSGCRESLGGDQGDGRKTYEAWAKARRR